MIDLLKGVALVAALMLSAVECTPPNPAPDPEAGPSVYRDWAVPTERVDGIVDRMGQG